MPALQERLSAEQVAARKAQDKPLTLLLGTILSDVKNRAIELKRALTDDDVIDVLQKGVKKRRESIPMLSTTTKSIEEISTTVLHEVGLDKHSAY